MFVRKARAYSSKAPRVGSWSYPQIGCTRKSFQERTLSLIGPMVALFIRPHVREGCDLLRTNITCIFDWSQTGMSEIEILSLSTLPNWAERRKVFFCSGQILHQSGKIFSIQVENGWDFKSGMTKWSSMTSSCWSIAEAKKSHFSIVYQKNIWNLMNSHRLLCKK